MSMFDEIVGVPEDTVCSECGHPLGGFQSKSGECVLDRVHFSKVKTFYTYCGKCMAWHEWTRGDVNNPTMKNYTLVINKEEDKHT